MMMRCIKGQTPVYCLHLIYGIIYTVNVIHFIDVIDLIFIIDIIFPLLSTIHLSWKLTRPVMPQPVVPPAVLFTGNLPVLGCGIKTEVPQVFLQ